MSSVGDACDALLVNVRLSMTCAHDAYLHFPTYWCAYVWTCRQKLCLWHTLQCHLHTDALGQGSLLMHLDEDASVSWACQVSLESAQTLACNASYRAFCGVILKQQRTFVLAVASYSSPSDRGCR